MRKHSSIRKDQQVWQRLGAALQPGRPLEFPRGVTGTVWPFLEVSLRFIVICTVYNAKVASVNLVMFAMHGLSDNSVRSVYLSYVLYGFAFASPLVLNGGRLETSIMVQIQK